MFEVQFDTGSSDLWIPQAGCVYCAGKNTYNHNLSSTYMPVGGTLNDTYGLGCVVGPLSMDNVTVGGFAVKNQVFAEIPDLSSENASHYLTQAYDGILGLAFPKASGKAGAYPVVFENMIEQNLLDQLVFSLYLGDNEPGWDATKFNGEIYKVPLSSAAFWQIELQGFVLGKGRHAQSVPAIVDSGTSFISGPPEAIQVIAEIFGAIAFDQNGDYFANCSHIGTLPRIGFIVGGLELLIPGHKAFLPPTDGYCKLAFGIHEGFWILGDTFMRGFYTVFIYVERTVDWLCNFGHKKQ